MIPVYVYSIAVHIHCMRLSAKDNTKQNKIRKTKKEKNMFAIIASNRNRNSIDFDLAESNVGVCT